MKEATIQKLSMELMELRSKLSNSRGFVEREHELQNQLQIAQQRAKLAEEKGHAAARELSKLLEESRRKESKLRLDLSDQDNRLVEIQRENAKKMNESRMKIDTLNVEVEELKHSNT